MILGVENDSDAMISAVVVPGLMPFVKIPQNSHNFIAPANIQISKNIDTVIKNSGTSHNNTAVVTVTPPVVAAAVRKRPPPSGPPPAWALSGSSAPPI